MRCGSGRAASGAIGGNRPVTLSAFFVARRNRGAWRQAQGVCVCYSSRQRRVPVCVIVYADECVCVGNEGRKWALRSYARRGGDAGRNRGSTGLHRRSVWLRRVLVIDGRASSFANGPFLRYNGLSQLS